MVKINISNNNTFLDLFNHKLTKIPKLIGNRINLQNLYLSNNNITKIPKSIGNLINLKELYLCNNNLIKIPKTIGNLINLQDLYLNNNRIMYLSLYQITNIFIFNTTNAYNKNFHYKNKVIISNKNIKRPYNCKLIIKN